MKTTLSSVRIAILTLALALSAIPVAVHASEIPKFPATVDAMGKKLQLNGTGLRTATIFHVKVYEAGLYLPQKSSDPSQILQSNDPRVIRMAFLRDVSQKQVQDAWRDGLEKNCDGDCEQLDSAFEHFVSQMPGAKAGDLFVYLFMPQGVRVIRNGRPLFDMNNPRLAKAVLSTWLGKKPPSDDLKRALLGQGNANVG